MNIITLALALPTACHHDTAHGMDPRRHLTPDRDAVMDWMDANQLGRRNLSPDQRSLIRGRRYNRTKAKHGGDRKGEGSSCQSVNLPPIERPAPVPLPSYIYEEDDEPSPVHTPPPQPELATEHGVSEATVKRAGKFAADADDLRKEIEKKEEVVSDKKLSHTSHHANTTPTKTAALFNTPQAPPRPRRSPMTTQTLDDQNAHHGLTVRTETVKF